MTRPNIDPASLVTGTEAWDALLRDVISTLAKTPTPIPEFANLAALPTAGSYDRCIATTVDTNKLYFSAGGSWREVAFV